MSYGSLTIHPHPSTPPFGITHFSATPLITTMSACAVTPDITTTPTKIPLMKWSQTRDAVHVVVEIRSPDTLYTPTVTFTPERLCVEATTVTANYRVDAELYGAILPDKSAWRVAANGQLFVTLAKRFIDDDEAEGEDNDKAEGEDAGDTDTTEQAVEGADGNTGDTVDAPAYRYCGWWDHPFHDRAYKGFVKIDWTRWTDEPDEHMEGDDEDSDDEGGDIGPLGEASPFDFGGGEDGNFPSEQGNTFQDMLKTMGGGKDGQMPNMEEMAKDFDMSKMEEMMKSLGSGDMTGMEGLNDLDLGKMGDMLGSLGGDEEGSEEGSSSGEEAENREAESHSASCEATEDTAC